MQKCWSYDYSRNAGMSPLSNPGAWLEQTTLSCYSYRDRGRTRTTNELTNHKRDKEKERC